MNVLEVLLLQGVTHGQFSSKSLLVQSIIASQNF